jgi:hypothetical protein
MPPLCSRGAFGTHPRDERFIRGGAERLVCTRSSDQQLPRLQPQEPVIDSGRRLLIPRGWGRCASAAISAIAAHCPEQIA